MSGLVGGTGSHPAGICCRWTCSHPPPQGPPEAPHTWPPALLLPSPPYGSINPVNASKKEKSKCQICRDGSIEGILIVMENTLTLFTYLVCSLKRGRIHQILSQHIIMLFPSTAVIARAPALPTMPVPTGMTEGERGRWCQSMVTAWSPGQGDSLEHAL